MKFEELPERIRAEIGDDPRVIAAVERKIANQPGGFITNIEASETAKKVKRQPPPRPTHRVSTGKGRRPLAISVLHKRYREVADCLEGQRAVTLFKAAARAGNFIASGLLTEDEVIETLTRAGRRCGLDDWEIDRTLRNGIARGMLTPAE